jgi:hypothetical protein
MLDSIHSSRQVEARSETNGLGANGAKEISWHRLSRQLPPNRCAL